MGTFVFFPLSYFVLPIRVWVENGGVRSEVETIEEREGVGRDDKPLA